MIIKQSTLLLVTSITLTFVVLFGYIYANTIVIEACTDMVMLRVDTIIAKQERHQIDHELDDTIQEVNRLVESVREENCSWSVCHGGEK